MITEDLAQRIAEDFIDKTLGGCQVERYHAHGASGVILIGTDGTEKVAIKIYGKHLINDAPDVQAKAELERIQRQVSIKDQTHPNIVKTRRAGQCERTKYHYLIMDMVEDKTLEEVLSDIPRDKIRGIIRDIAKAALFLQQSLGHVHRDIKPPNVAINLDTMKVTLLDLGLIRPVDGETITDQAPRFVGTKKYAPPEFLNGSMSHDERGWDAVSFYQLGAVLYCLIMRKPLFDGLSGAELIRAIERQVPQIDAIDVPADLVQLARDCLQKDTATRLRLVYWDRFLAAPDPNAAANEMDRLRAAVKRFSPLNEKKLLPAGADQHAIQAAYKTLNLAIDYHVRSLLNSDEAVFPQHEVKNEQTSPTSFQITAAITYHRHSIEFVVTAIVSCKLIDAASLLCRCDLTTYAASATKQFSMPVLTLFEGSFVEGVFSNALDENLPKVLAQVLNSSPDQPDSIAPNGGAA